MEFTSPLHFLSNADSQTNLFKTRQLFEAVDTPYCNVNMENRTKGAFISSFHVGT